MSQYSAAVPGDGQVRPEIKAYFERFYAVSDTPDGHENYADMFTNSGKLIMGPNAVEGRDGEFAVLADLLLLTYNSFNKLSSRCVTACGRR